LLSLVSCVAPTMVLPLFGAAMKFVFSLGPLVASVLTIGVGCNSGGDSQPGSKGGEGGSSEGPSETITLTMDSFTVPPGGEVYKCQNFKNPFGTHVDVGAFESHMTPGSHHLLLFYRPGSTDSALEDCSGLEFAATPYSTQLPDDSLSFPPGVA